MASIAGLDSNAILQIATTWGTAVAAGAGDKFAGEISPNFNVSELVARGIGSGAQMALNATIGNYIPTISLVGDLGYRNNWDKLCAAFMGTSGAPAEQNTGEGDYLHTITFNSTLNPKYLTLAYDDTSTTTAEFPTCAVQSFGIKTTSVPGYLEGNAELLAGIFNASSSTNTNATNASATWTEGTPELAAVAFDDDYWTNDQSGDALDSGDLYAITSFDLQLQRPQEIVPEIKGSAGNSAPVKSGAFAGTFNVTVKELADHAYYTLWAAFTTRKASVTVEGTQIAAGDNKAWSILLPSMQLITEPQYALTAEGTNTLSLAFKLLKAGSNPTGMSNTYPHFLVTNTLSTSLLA